MTRTIRVRSDAQIAKFMGPTWGPPGYCRPHDGPINLAIRVIIAPRHPVVTSQFICDIWWRYEMDYWPFVKGIHRWPVDSLHNGTIIRSFDLSLMSVWTSCSINRWFLVISDVILMQTILLSMMTSSNGNNFRVTGHLCGEFTGPRWIPAQRPVTRSFDVFIDLRRNNDWVNTRETGDLRRYRAHYDVIVMYRHHRFMDNHCFCRPMTTVPVLYRVQKRYTYTLCFNLTKPNLTWPLPYLINEVNPCSLIRKCRHCDEIIITDCTGSCHFDNFRCSRWWKFHQNDYISVSVVS